MESQILFSRLCDIPPEQMEWLWTGKIPIGSLTILEGDPGQGKSTLTYDLAARVTAGKAMPGETAAIPPAGAVLLQAEDDPASIMRTRLAAAGANLSRVLVFKKNEGGQRPFLLPDDIGVLEQAVVDAAAKLIVLDPVSVFLQGSAASDQCVRRMTEALAALAKRRGAAVIMVRHLIKGGSNNRLYTGAGSIALIAAARSMLRIVNDPASGDPFHRLIYVAKSNLAVVPAFAYKTIQVGDATTIEWLGESTNFSFEGVDTAAGRQSRLEEAVQVLFSILEEGPVWAKAAMKLAADSGVASRTLDRAKSYLGVDTFRDGLGESVVWFWRLLPDHPNVQRLRNQDKKGRWNTN